METRDVLIVGGGPAASACASRLHAAGLDVLVLDGALFPRDKPCAGWVSPDVFHLAGLSVIDYGVAATVQAMTGARIGLIGGSEVTVDHGETVSYGIRRAELDRSLLLHSGAPFLIGRPVTDLRRAKGTWIVDGAYRAPIVVGAGGSRCPVARLLNERPAPTDLVVAESMEIRLGARDQAGCRTVPELPEIHFCPDLRGYGWCFRKGDYLNVGLGRRGDPDGLRSHVRRYVEWQTARGRLPANLPSRFKGHAYLLYGSISRRLVDDGVMLVGDAAGVATPESGEGIRPAMESGLLAAEAILAAAGRHGREDLASYEDALVRRFGARRRPGSPGAVAAWAGSRLLGWGFFAKTFVLDRIFLGRNRSPLLLPALPAPRQRAA